MAELDATGQATFSFHAQSTADWQWTPEELAKVDLSETTCVHTGSLVLVREPGAAVVEEFLTTVAPQATISIDPNVRPLLVNLQVYTTGWPTGAASRTSSGFLGGRLIGLGLGDVTEACRFAPRVAALTCSVPGPTPPWRRQLVHLATTDDS